VQSVAVRLIVEREEERRAFRTAVYWDLEAKAARRGARVRRHAGAHQRSAHRDGQGLRRENGELKNTNVRLLDDAQPGALAQATRANVPWTVTGVEQKPGVERPAPPFTTRR
jgi:DNA topoisomerase-1